MSSIKEFSQTNKQNIINHTNSSSSKRTPSFSSSSSSSSNSSFSFISQEFSIPNTPSTSFHHNSSSKGIPFSWETIPGIPKTQMILKKVDSSRKPKMTNLPLPPPISTTKTHYISRKDPFYVALVECSKGGDAGFEDKDSLFGCGNNNNNNNNNNNVKSLSTRFGLVNMSCKNNSTSVSESLVFLPRGGPRRVSYDLLKKRSG